MRIVLGVITGAHGVQGHVRARLFTPSPERLPRYTSLGDKEGARRVRVRSVSLLSSAEPSSNTGANPREAKLVLEDVATRDQAEALKGMALAVDRAELPGLQDDEFYLSDLIGCRVTTTAGHELGHVTQVQNYGAQDVLEVSAGESPSTVYTLPLTREAVPTLNLAEHHLVVDDAFVIDPRSATKAHRPAKEDCL